MEYTNALMRIANVGEDLADLHDNPGRDLVKYVEKNGKRQMYQFIRYIDKGGESVVILAYDPRAEQYVAIKFALPIFHQQEKKTSKKEDTAEIWQQEPRKRIIPNKEQKEVSTNRRIEMRFLKEAQFQKRLHDFVVSNLKNIAYVPDVYHSMGGAFVYSVQEYVEANPLMEWVKDKDDIEIVSFFHKMVQFIKIAFHDREPPQVHGDIKPGNILVTKDSLPCFLDFSTSKAVGEMRTGVTLREDQIYSIYSSPHQYLDFQARDDLDDIHALATTLHSMLQGFEPAWSGQFSDYHTWDIFRPSKIPRYLRGLFTSSTTTKEQEKYGDISEMLEELELILKPYTEKTVRQVRDKPESSLVSQMQRENRVLMKRESVTVETDSRFIRDSVVDKRFEDAIIAELTFLQEWRKV